MSLRDFIPFLAPKLKEICSPHEEEKLNQDGIFEWLKKNTDLLEKSEKCGVCDGKKVDLTFHTSVYEAEQHMKDLPAIDDRYKVKVPFVRVKCMKCGAGWNRRPLFLR